MQSHVGASSYIAANRVGNIVSSQQTSLSAGMTNCKVGIERTCDELPKQAVS